MTTSRSGGGRGGPPPILYFVLGIGALWLVQSQGPRLAGWLQPLTRGLPLPSKQLAGGTSIAAVFPMPASVPAGTTIRIDGSTSMVLINEALRRSFLAAYPGTSVETAAAGSDNGLQALLGGSINLAALSRPLTAEEQARGLEAVPVSRDRIAVVVGVDNPFRRGLSLSQLAEVFTGRISSWATFGGVDRPIRVLLRPSVSGTSKAFRSLVLANGAFGSGPRIVTLHRDATTPMLRLLGPDGIGYATYGQVADQRTARVLAIDGITPEAANYPLQRPLFYAYRKPADPAVRAFLGYALSPTGRSRIDLAVGGHKDPA
jgi:phosphate transport system substrate-binding protein